MLNPLPRTLTVSSALFALLYAGCADEDAVVLAAHGTSRDIPIRLDVARIPLLEIPESEWTAVAERFRPRLSLADETVSTPSLCVHALRLHGVEGTFEDQVLPNGAQVIRALTDNAFATKVFGVSLLHETRWGVRYRPKEQTPDVQTYADADHIDQTLASLVELGVPLTTPVLLANGTRTLADVLADAVSNFNLEEGESEWTSVALALCLPPQTTWTNRFGEHFTFDQMADRLIRKRFRGLSCGGTHVFYSMVVLAQVHRRHDVLSKATAGRLKERIDQLLARVRSSQRKDGSWDTQWFRDRNDPKRIKSARSTLFGRTIITGHLGEIFLRLPASQRIQPEALRRAGSWLWGQLPKQIRSKAFARSFCPLTHAAVVVQALRKQ